MTAEQKQAYEWAKNQDYQSVAARYARFLAGLVDELQAESKRLKDALETAIDCIGECEYACHKVYNSRIEEAVNDWETYAEAHNVDNLLTEMVGEN